jgi:hypothetical protein
LTLRFSLTFVLFLVYQMLPVSLDCPFLIDPSVFSNLCPVSCVPNVTSVSGLSLRFSLTFVLFLVYQMLPVSLD